MFRANMSTDYNTRLEHWFYVTGCSQPRLSLFPATAFIFTKLVREDASFSNLRKLFFCSLPYHWQEQLDSFSCLGQNPKCPFFSHPTCNTPENPVSSTFKIYPEPDHFSPPPLPSTRLSSPAWISAGTSIWSPHTALYVPLWSILNTAAKEMMLKHKSDLITLLLKPLQWLIISLSKVKTWPLRCGPPLLL